jgi:hypothetical protein
MKAARDVDRVVITDGFGRTLRQSYTVAHRTVRGRPKVRKPRALGYPSPVYAERRVKRERSRFIESLSRGLSIPTSLLTEAGRDALDRASARW